MTIDHSLGDGVYYAIDDYAGFLSRIAVMISDSIVLLFTGTMIWFILLATVSIIGSEFDPSGILLLLWLVTAWLYLTVLKRSRFRTIGYRLLGLKIVTTKGTRPSLLTMTVRMLLWIFGPFNLFFDLLWIGADSEQQSIRDCYLGTYVVRHTAEPIGTAPIHLTRYCGAGLTLAYPRVVRPKI